MNQAKSILASIAALGALHAAPAAAQNTAAPQAVSAIAAADDDQGAFAAAALSDHDLGRTAGREDTATMIANANQRNTVANNSVSGNSVTGDVQIDGNSFQNLQGLAVISANTGNNVAINSAMNVTINLAR
ncbi:MAG: hypothetical protein ACTHMG_10700 [Sphingomonas sp.]